MEIAALAIAVVFVLIHLFGSWLKALDAVPRNWWLSAASGTSVAYVFLHLLPAIAHEGKVALGDVWLLEHLEAPSLSVALLGLVVFYGLERLARDRRPAHAFAHHDQGDEDFHDGLFWLHMTSFALYNLVIGYLLVNGAHEGLQGLGLFGLAIGLHFLVTDHSLRHQHQQTYRRIGRWILASVILVGWGLGVLVVFSETVVKAFEAFVGGGIIMNVLKEELPEDRNSRFTAFLVGAAGYSALLVVL